MIYLKPVVLQTSSKTCNPFACTRLLKRLYLCMAINCAVKITREFDSRSLASSHYSFSLCLQLEPEGLLIVWKQITRTDPWPLTSNISVTLQTKLGRRQMHQNVLFKEVVTRFASSSHLVWPPAWMLSSESKQKNPFPQVFSILECGRNLNVTIRQEYVDTSQAMILLLWARKKLSDSNLGLHFVGSKRKR